MTVCHSSRDPLLPAYVEHYLRANAAAVHLVLVGEDRDLKHLAGQERVHAHDLSRTPTEEMPVAIRELRDRLILRTDFLLVTETDEWLLPRFGTDLAGLLSAYLGEPVLGAVTYEVKPGPGDNSLDLTEPLPGQRSLGVRQDWDARPAAFGSKISPRWRHQQMLVPFLRLRFGRSDSRVYQERRPVVPPLHPDEQAWEVWLATPGTVRIPGPGSWANSF